MATLPTAWRIISCDTALRWSQSTTPVSAVVDPVDDLYALTPSVVVAAHSQVHRHVARALAAGELAHGIPALTSTHHIGLGHSMGGMLTDVLQSRHRPFTAIVGLGHTGTATRICSPTTSGLPSTNTDASTKPASSGSRGRVFARQSEGATGRARLASNTFFHPTCHRPYAKHSARK